MIPMAHSSGLTVAVDVSTASQPVTLDTRRSEEKAGNLLSVAHRSVNTESSVRLKRTATRCVMVSMSALRETPAIDSTI